MKRVAIVGAGLMGAQIGAEYALAGHEVTLFTRSPATAGAALQRAQAALRALAQHGLVPIDRAEAGAARLQPSHDLRDACAGRDVIVESVAEDLNVKADVLDTAARSSPEALICSNTSSLPITTLGEAARAPERLLGTHYANPAILMPLVEVVPGARTEPRRVDEAVRLLEGMGKRPVVVPDLPGFLWNRLQFALLREAVRLVSEYGVDPAAIDLVVRGTLGRRWSLVGPFETLALGGRETFLSIARLLFDDLGQPVDPEAITEIPLPPAEALRSLAAERDERLVEWRKRDLGERP